MVGYAPTRDLISFKLIAPALHELTVFDLLTRAITEQHEISFDYRKLGAPAPAVRRVQPLHLTHREGRWYLIAQDLERSAMRTFALGRIADVTPTGKTFERPRDFSVDRYFAAALSVMNGRETHHVRLRFSRLAADDVRDRFFHESQAFHPQPDGSLDLTLTLADLLEVQRIVLQWGGHVIALEPPELRERIRALGETLVQSHASPSADDQRL
jgi:proteasome accessory factor B